MKTLSLLIIFLMAACGGGSSNSSTADYASESMMLDEVVEESASFYSKRADDSQPAEEIQKKVIKTGGLSYRVESTKEEYTRLSGLLKQYEAYISSENENKGYDRVNYNVSVKVPPQHFDALITDITKDRKLDNRWVNASDVTDRYYDLQSRISNKQKLEERYLDILKQASKISDILEVERNLNQVRTEIESLQGQFKLLNHQISFSTIDISIYEIIPYELDQDQRPGFGARLLNSITAGWQGFLTFLVYILALWPFGLVAVGVVWIVKKIRARRKNK